MSGGGQGLEAKQSPEPEIPHSTILGGPPSLKGGCTMARVHEV
jgi:hypothetical protein